MVIKVKYYMHFDLDGQIKVEMHQNTAVYLYMHICALSKCINMKFFLKVKASVK